ncbi:hypothetical protein QVD17_01075 [Tagetes erecta]|uniref:F-box domain-containing protein n=1 Tax=Tagetes erecta TaxID=13708 RepID=A0AAD8L4C4_TARER|nr:hypothetical protein QVD17_01075 [Tagetes erecta]
MAELHVPDDLADQILVTLDVKDLIRFKSVCKSWYSLITSSRFVNRHLNRSYNKDHNNNAIAHRRISLPDDLFAGDYTDVHLVGSSNGLICVSLYKIRILVGNPLIRQVRDLSLPPSVISPSCWGFGYDSSTDDYKLIVGDFENENQTCVRVLSLKYNIWRVIGDVKYEFISKFGVLCKGALHWIVRDIVSKKILVISFDLSNEEFKLIDHPRCISKRSKLGVINGCLCTYKYCKWSQCGDEIKYDCVHYLIPPKYKKNSLYRDESWFYKDYICGRRKQTYAPIFVRSLVSPYFNMTPKEYMKVSNSNSSVN